jgi:hypothetical protein
MSASTDDSGDGNDADPFSKIAADDEVIMVRIDVSTVMINHPPSGLCLVRAVVWSTGQCTT